MAPTNKKIELPALVPRIPSRIYMTPLKISLMVNLVLAIGWLSSAWIRSPTQNVREVYFGLQEDGSVVPMTPLDQKGDTRGKLIGWTQKALVEIWDIQHNDYQSHIEGTCIKFFTDHGCQSFKAALEREQFFTKIAQYRINIYAFFPNNKSPLIQAGAEKPAVTGNGKKGWILQAPLIITWEGTMGSYPVKRIVKLRILQDRTKPGGISIDLYKDYRI